MSRGGALSRAKNSRGCGSKVSTAGGRRKSSAASHEPKEHRLVAAMHAVEVADRQRDRAVGAGGKSAKEAHVMGTAGSTPYGAWSPAADIEPKY